MAVRAMGYGLLFALCGLLLFMTGGFSGSRRDPDIGSVEALAAMGIAFAAGVVFGLSEPMKERGAAGVVARWVLSFGVGFGLWAVLGPIIFGYRSSLSGFLLIVGLGAGVGLGFALMFGPIDK